MRMHAERVVLRRGPSWQRGLSCDRAYTNTENQLCWEGADTSAELETTAKEQRCGALAGLGRPGEVAVPAERGVDFLVEVGGTLVARS